MHAVHRHKHLLLLVVAIVGLSLQPLTHRTGIGPIVFELLEYLLLLVVFLVIFHRRVERRIALSVGVPAIAASIVGNLTTGETSTAAMTTYHVLGVLFLGFAVAVILRGVFSSERIGHDQILDVFSGYLLAGIAWGNLYVMLHMLVPDAFNVAAGLAWQLEADDSRRFLFNYFSFITLTTVGYGDVTPLAPAACVLAWLEAMFGQFYTAVFVGQLIGLKLSQPRKA